MTIKRLLIANRGEIALRIMKTASRLNIETVAVYSTADASALHVKAADHAVLIGAAAARDSYLNMDSILQAATETGSDAIHPGYGFLAENPEFARRCEQAGITFIGPPVHAIESMGLKGVAKTKMMQAGVPVLAGINNVDEKTIADQLVEVGYPILVKPEAGGGGKGMKIVRQAEDLIAAITSAKREALSAFANDTLIVEKYLDHPRHIEIQIFADQHGNCVHLNERDCSLQRRHQKIIEEAPAPNFCSDLRQQMGEAAVMAAKAIDYVGAGTVEFLLADDGMFYFMEMNTRLQVEHPVTEMITGQDLVEWQLRVADGETLPLQQVDIGIHGHAVEARIYAEDPLNDFLPASGKIEYLNLPGEVRVDNGVSEGDSIGVHYDPMMMKIVAWSDSRTEAIDKLATALGSLHIAGIRTNRDFLAKLLHDKIFVSGTVPTDYLDRQSTFAAASEAELHDALSRASVHLLRKDKTRSAWMSETNFRLNQENSRDLIMSVGEDVHTIRTSVMNKVITIKTPYAKTDHGEDFLPTVFQIRNRLTVFLRERTITIELPGVDRQQAAESSKNVKAPMSGKVISVLVDAGATVDAGAALMVMEAMKMEHTIRAPSDGKIDEVYFCVDDLVEEGVELLNFQPNEAPTASNPVQAPP